MKNTNEKKPIMIFKSNQLFIILIFRFFSQIQIDQIHRTNAITVYMTNISFNHYENSYVIKSYKLLHLKYKFFNKKFIVEKLLNEAYEIIKFQIMKCLNICNHLNFFTNETTNIRKKRVINFCCYVFSSNFSFEKKFHLKIVVEIFDKMNAVTQIN